MAQKTFCDVCSGEIKNKGWWLSWCINDGEAEEAMDVCTKCLNLIKRFLREMSVKKGK